MPDRRKSLSSIVLYLLIACTACSAKDCIRRPTPIAEACKGKITCASGHIRVCIDKCKKLVGPGEACDRDPCVEPGTGSVCNHGLACIDGFCEPASRPECDLSNIKSSPCPDTDYCRSGQCPPPPGWSTSVEFCAATALEGAACDGNWVDTLDSTDSMLCSPCEPGLQCVKGSGESVGTCRRACDGDQQCPCGDYSCIAAVEPLGDFCDRCAPTGAACVDGDRTLSCCDAPAAICADGTCRSCGTIGNPCCENNKCSTGVCWNGSCANCVPQTFELCVCPSTGLSAKGVGCSMAEVRERLWKSPPAGACGIYVDGPCPTACDGKPPVQVTMCCAKWPVQLTQWGCTAEDARNAIRATEPDCNWQDGPC